MSKGFVGLSHLEGIFLLLDGGTGILKSIKEFTGESFGHGFTFAKAEPTVFEYPAQVAAQRAPFVWKLSHKGAKAYVEGEESYVPVRVNVWGTDHLISPEFIQHIELAPGETAAWTRKLTFVDELM